MMTWPTWIAMILGVWLIAAPYVLGYSDVLFALYNDVIVGILVAAMTYVGAMLRRREEARS